IHTRRKLRQLGGDRRRRRVPVPAARRGAYFLLSTNEQFGVLVLPGPGEDAGRYTAMEDGPRDAPAGRGDVTNDRCTGAVSDGVRRGGCVCRARPARSGGGRVRPLDSGDAFAGEDAKR